RRREPAHDPACVLAVRPGEQGVERLEKRPIGFTGAERLETATPRDPRAMVAFRRAREEPLREAGFADPGLARDAHDTPAAARCCGEAFLQKLELRLPPDERTRVRRALGAWTGVVSARALTPDGDRWGLGSRCRNSVERHGD